MSKQKISVSLGEKQVGRIEQVVGSEYRNRSEAVRDLIEKGFQYDDRVEELEREIEDVRRENDRLRKQLAATNRRVDQHQELVEYVQEERSVAQRREQRREAPAWRRAKWWLLGEPTDEGG